MTKLNRTINCTILENIHHHCTEIQKELAIEKDSNKNKDYQESIKRDEATLESLKLITVATRIDIHDEMISECTKLILLNAPQDYNKRLELIPIQKAKVKEIIDMLEIIHENIKKHI